MIFLTVCLLVGMVLGQRFKVLVMAPISAVTLVAAVSTGLVQGMPFASIALLSLGAITSLQIGYLIGITVRHLMVAARVGRQRIEQVSLPIPLRRTAA